MKELPRIEDKFNVESASELVVIGYPENKEMLVELIFWSCFPNDPVCWVTYRYIDSLRDDYLAPEMAKFLEFHYEANQLDLVSNVFNQFINERGLDFRELVLSFVTVEKVRELFTWKEYSLEVYRTK